LHWMLEAPKAPAECTAGAQAIKQNRKRPWRQRHA